jgi:hypothetical protein
MRGHAAAVAAFPLLITMLSPAPAGAQTMKLGQVLVFHEPDVKADADVKAFESQVAGKIAPAWNTNAPGMTLTLVRKDRGNREGRYMMVWTTDTLTRHKGYASEGGEFPFRQALTTRVGDFRTALAPFVNGPGKYVEYHLVAPEKVPTMPEVDVLGLHYARVRPDRREAFDRFIVEKLHPAVANLRPDLRLLYYRPVRGAEPGDYVTVFALTKASRDKYWPKGADSDDVRAAFSPSVRALTDELRTYLVEGAYATGDLAAAVFESKEWADWVLVSPTAKP